jgi:hypothetical protein
MQKSEVPFRIISDLDDTIKISNTQAKLKTLVRGVFRSSAFLGMSELYQQWADVIDSTPAIYIVSSSPRILQNRIQKFLVKNSFPPSELFLRHWIKQPSVSRFKRECLEAIASKHREPLILIGDDTEHDPEILQKFKAKYPKRVLACYIHKIKGRELPEGLIGFYTAFDPACAEVTAGRLKQEQALQVGKVVLNAKLKARLIPRYSTQLPVNFAPTIAAEHKKLSDQWTKIHKKLQAKPKREKK